jgi:integrase
MSKQRKRRDGVYWRKDRRKYYLSYIDERGERQRPPASLNWDESQTMLAEAVARVQERKRELAKLRPGEILPCDDSFAAVADRFLAYQKPRLSDKGYERDRGIVEEHLKPLFAGTLAEVTPAEVSDFLTMRLGKVSKSSARKELTTLKHLFGLACGEWKLLARFANPCLDVKAPKVHDERTQHLDPDQFRRLLAAAPENMRPIFALLTATGMRRSELVCCRWKYVTGARILLPTSKNDEPKEIHLNIFAQKVLASIPQGNPEDRLFPDVTPEAVSMAFHRVCELLKISDIRLHDLRHTFGTWLRQQGVELDIIASQLGHRDLRMTKRYARIASTQVKQAVQGLDAILEPAQKPETNPVSHLLVTAPEAPDSENEVSPLESWRPRRDLNPCYRRERAWTTSNLLKRRDTDGSQRHVQ